MMKRRFARFWKLLGLLLLCATPKKKSTGFVFTDHEKQTEFQGRNGSPDAKNHQRHHVGKGRGAAAIYLTIKEETDEQTAYAVIENAAIRNTLAARS